MEAGRKRRGRRGSGGGVIARRFLGTVFVHNCGFDS